MGALVPAARHAYVRPAALRPPLSAAAGALRARDGARPGALLAELGRERCLVVCGEHVGAAAWLGEIVDGAGGRIVDVTRAVRPHAPCRPSTRWGARTQAARRRPDQRGRRRPMTPRAAALCLASGPVDARSLPGSQCSCVIRRSRRRPALIAIPSTFSGGRDHVRRGRHPQRAQARVRRRIALHLRHRLRPEVYMTTPRATLLPPE